MHQDTFIHGDDLQRQNGQWYFHRYGSNSYKGGTYKGLDISFGKGAKAHGGILIRSLISLSPPPVNDFIEGPCNSVNKILKLNSDGAKDLEIVDLVGLKNFSLDIFNKESCLHFSGLHETENKDLFRIIETKNLFKCPRVGLTLKRHDAHKERFWMIDYRYFIYPDKNKKYSIFIILAMIKQGFSTSQIAKETKSKAQTIEELKANYEAGLVDK